MGLTLNQKLLLGYLVFILIYWVILQQSGQQTSIWNYLYSFSFSIVPLIGGVIGISISKQWGFLSSATGRAIFYISAGLFFWGVGSMIWAYYNIFLNIPAPYPSIADAAYVISWPLWSVGIINLSRGTGMKFSLERMRGKLLLFIVPVILIMLSYYLLVVVGRAGSVSDFSQDKFKVFFDLAYPIGDVVILSLAVLVFGLSLNYLGGRYRLPILALLLGFALNYVADFIFSYTTTAGTFYVGNFGDLIFALTFFLLTFGIFGFSNPAKLKEE